MLFLPGTGSYRGSGVADEANYGAAGHASGEVRDILTARGPDRECDYLKGRASLTTGGLAVCNESPPIMNPGSSGPSLK